MRIIGHQMTEGAYIVSVDNGGTDNIDNLKPICATCNKSMGTENLEEFKNKHFPLNACIQTNVVVLPYQDRHQLCVRYIYCCLKTP